MIVLLLDQDRLFVSKPLCNSAPKINRSTLKRRIATYRTDREGLVRPLIFVSSTVEKGYLDKFVRTFRNNSNFFLVNNQQLIISGLNVQYILDTKKPNIPRMAFLRRNSHTLNDTITLYKDSQDTCQTEEIYIKVNRF